MAVCPARFGRRAGALSRGAAGLGSRTAARLSGVVQAAVCGSGSFARCGMVQWEEGAMGKTEMIAGGRAVSPPEPDLTVVDMIRRAEVMALKLIPRSAETQKRGYYSEETHEDFKQAGFYRMMVPRSCGGYEMGIDAYSEMVKAIARGCPSTAWQLCFGAAHPVNVGTMFPSHLWPEIYGDGHFISALTVKPQGELVEQEDGDWRLTGTYDYCSGIPYATHFSGQAIPVFRDGTKGGPVTFIARHEDWVMLDNWGDMLGMKGSGSQSIVFDNALIPDRFVLRKEVLSHAPGARDKSDPKQSNCPNYYGRFASALIAEPAAIAVGAMKGALDEYGQMMKDKMTMRPPIQIRAQDTDYRQWYGHARGQLAVAEAALRNMTTSWMEAARQNMEGEAPFSVAKEIELIYVASEVIKIVWNAMDILWFSAGSSAARDGERLQMFFRDIAMARAHALNTFTDLLTRELSDEILETVGGVRDSFFGNSYKRV